MAKAFEALDHDASGYRGAWWLGREQRGKGPSCLALKLKGVCHAIVPKDGNQPNVRRQILPTLRVAARKARPNARLIGALCSDLVVQIELDDGSPKFKCKLRQRVKVHLSQELRLLVFASWHRDGTTAQVVEQLAKVFWVTVDEEGSILAARL